MTDPLPYATPLPARSSHDMIYSLLLGLYAFFTLVAALVLWFIALPATRQPPDSGRVMQMILCIYLALLLFEVVVLAVRIFSPAHRK